MFKVLLILLLLAGNTFAISTISGTAVTESTSGQSTHISENVGGSVMYYVAPTPPVPVGTCPVGNQQMVEESYVKSSDVEIVPGFLDISNQFGYWVDRRWYPGVATEYIHKISLATPLTQSLASASEYTSQISYLRGSELRGELYLYSRESSPDAVVVKYDSSTLVNTGSVTLTGYSTTVCGIGNNSQTGKIITISDNAHDKVTLIDAGTMTVDLEVPTNSATFRCNGPGMHMWTNEVTNTYYQGYHDTATNQSGLMKINGSTLTQTIANFNLNTTFGGIVCGDSTTNTVYWFDITTIQSARRVNGTTLAVTASANAILVTGDVVRACVVDTANQYIYLISSNRIWKFNTDFTRAACPGTGCITWYGGSAATTTGGDIMIDIPSQKLYFSDTGGRVHKISLCNVAPAS